MGFLSDIGHSISKVTKKAAQQLQTNVAHIPQFSKEVAQVAMLPVTTAMETVGVGLTTAAPILEQATGILQSNPLLAGALQSATGLPINQWMAGGQIPQQAMAPAPAPSPVYAAPAAAPADDGPAVPVWAWIVGAAALLGGAFLVLRRKG